VLATQGHQPGHLLLGQANLFAAVLGWVRSRTLNGSRPASLAALNGCTFSAAVGVIAFSRSSLFIIRHSSFVIRHSSFVIRHSRRGGHEQSRAFRLGRGRQSMHANRVEPGRGEPLGDLDVAEAQPLVTELLAEGLAVRAPPDR